MCVCPYFEKLLRKVSEEGAEGVMKEAKNDPKKQIAGLFRGGGFLGATRPLEISSS